MEQIEFNRQKYLDIAKKTGFQSAVNQLHQDLWDIEKECFDTPVGYRPDVWKTLNEMRIFSRELWDMDRGQA